jgi:hypothetical protein
MLSIETPNIASRGASGEVSSTSLIGNTTAFGSKRQDSQSLFTSVYREERPPMKDNHPVIATKVAHSETQTNKHMTCFVDRVFKM